ncbi:hypothetical protein PGTUg99_003716 [Puccinia graminis f. sp. tritici]|uniref:Uncharacterized protein n=1 Tax=Puccinia graminis f. sp. tritici TaxID=56615 RepID=A0A5B0RVH8_PUCGR|nr:hypothetical protein PGTUg99_003716 [Puccinia graminis f. sp. tritici]
MPLKALWTSFWLSRTFERIRLSDPTMLAHESSHEHSIPSTWTGPPESRLGHPIEQSSPPLLGPRSSVCQLRFSFRACTIDPDNHTNIEFAESTSQVSNKIFTINLSFTNEYVFMQCVLAPGSPID